MKSIAKGAWFLCLLWAITACDSTEPGGGVSPEKGYAVGKVTNADGSPLEGAEIVIDNSMFHASYSLGTSDKNGNYKIQLPTVGTFMASAEIKRRYNGQEYTLFLDPDVFEAFSIDGAVRNFTWKMTGRRPEGEGYYGASVEINKDVMSNVYDSENIEFTLTPVGNLIDGSKGSTIRLKPGQPRTEDYNRLPDIPLGRYIATAYYSGEHGKRPLKMRKHFSDDPYTSELAIDFEPNTIWGNNIFILSYLE